MSEVIQIVLISFLIVLVAVSIYPVCIYIKMRIHKRKIKKALNSIYNQVDFKYSLLKEYLEINKDEIEEEKYEEISEQLLNFNFKNKINVRKLKTLNEIYSRYLTSFDDSLLNRTCKESEEKIGRLRGYYNALVGIHNHYNKATKINSVISKALLVCEEMKY